MKNIKIFILFLFATLTYPFCTAQISFGGFPRVPERCNLRSSDETPCLTFVDTIEAKNEDFLCAKQFAKKIPVDIDVKQEAAMLKISDEAVQYRLKIASPNALSLNLIFSEFDIPDGARLYITTPDMGEIYGAYTNHSHQKPYKFATTPIENDTLMIIYEEPMNAEGKLKISSVNRGFFSLRKLPIFQSSQSCEVDIECTGDAVRNLKNSVCLIIINGTKFCTGTLINNTADDGTPYVLSSAHCLFDAYNKVDTTLAESCVFFFGYESPLCGSGIEGTREKSIAGATIATHNKRHDMLLLKLSSEPPIDYLPLYAGWNNSGDVSASSYCIHHPSGDVKKISTESDKVQICTFSSDIFAMYSHWKIELWEEGITEGGSSGSPLFNMGRIIGALSGGNTEISCENTGYDCFWRLDSSWEDLAPYLDPMGYDATYCDDYNPYSNPCIEVSNYNSMSKISDGYIEKFGFIAGSNEDGLTEIAERFVLPCKDALLHGVSFSPVSASFSVSHPIYMSVLDENFEVLQREEIRVKNVQYIKKRKEMDTTDIESLSYKENYIRFNTPINVSDTFYISFDYGETARKFAMFTTDSKSGFAKENGEWKEMKDGRGLMVKAIVQKMSDDKIKETENCTTMFYPNPAADYVSLLLNEGDEIESVKISDGNGKNYSVKFSQNKIDLRRLNANSIYIIDVWSKRGERYVGRIEKIK